MIANIALDDALILPHGANPAGLNFRERQVSAAPDARTSFGGWLTTALKRRAARLILFDLEIYRRLLTAVTLNLVLNGLSFIERCQSGTFSNSGLGPPADGLGSTTCSDFLRRNRHSNRVSASCGLRFRETGFRGQRKMRRNDLPTVTVPSLRTTRRTDPRQLGAFRTPSGNLR